MTVATLMGRRGFSVVGLKPIDYKTYNSSKNSKIRSWYHFGYRSWHTPC